MVNDYTPETLDRLLAHVTERTHWDGCESEHPWCQVAKCRDAWRADRQRLEAAEEALRWLVNVYHGVGKSGEEPTDAEFEAAIEAGKAALAGEDACGCGHPGSAHNEYGCCWDDECDCDRPRSKVAP